MRDATWMAGGWTILHLLWIGCVLGALALVVARTLRAERPMVRYGAALLLLLAWSAAPIVIFGLVYEPAGTHSGSALTVADRMASHSPEDHGATTAQQLGRSSNSAWDMEALAAITPWIWLSGATLTFAWLIFGLTGVGRLRRRAEPIDDPVLLAILDRGRQALRISRRVAMATCATLKSPVLAGIFKPIILLPPGLALGLSPAQVEMVILHELAHIRRWDNFVNLVQRIVECALFFHPFTWWLSRHLRREREHCCDALVVSQTGRPRTYARTLLQLTSPQSLSPALVPMAEGDVVERVRRILSNRKPRPMISIRLFVVLGVATCLLTILVPAISQTRTSTEHPSRSAINSSKSGTSGHMGLDML
ncbi:MAG: M56 family metallopeptidase, partial [Planctomycetes bacterium]|nr:M56 family metallopeptidase [Planctomycetota bacterium]